MLKKPIIFIAAALLALTVTGCAKDSSPEPQDPVPENPVAILDRDGKQTGAIDDRAIFTATDNGLFYSIVSLEEASFTGTAQYRFFNFEDGQDILLGTVEKQGYEASFARTELGGMIYTLAVRGDPIGDSAVPLLLLAFDPANRSMKTVTVTETGFPYAAMTVSEGKLLIMNHEMTEEKTDIIYQYDPDSESVKEVLSFDADTDSLRGIYATGDGIYLLRLKLNAGGENELYIDLYDRAFGKVSEQSVDDISEAAVMSILGIFDRQDVMNELGMYVSRFAVIGDRYMVYENFGLSRFIVDLHSGETVLAKDDTYSFSTGNGSPVIYRMDFDKDAIEDPEIYGIENGGLRQIPFTPADSHKMIINISRSASGKWAILTADDYPVNRGTAVIRILPE